MWSEQLHVLLSIRVAEIWILGDHILQGMIKTCILVRSTAILNVIYEKQNRPISISLYSAGTGVQPTSYYFVNF